MLVITKHSLLEYCFNSSVLISNCSSSCFTLADSFSSSCFRSFTSPCMNSRFVDSSAFSFSFSCLMLCISIVRLLSLVFRAKYNVCIFLVKFFKCTIMVHAHSGALSIRCKLNSSSEQSLSSYSSLSTISPEGDQDPILTFFLDSSCELFDEVLLGRFIVLSLTLPVYSLASLVSLE